MKEEFRDITGYEGLYQASDLGRIKSLERKVKTKNGYRIVREKILKTSKDKNGYLLVNLHKNNKMKTHRVHRIIAQTFIPNHENLPQINHIDENTTNNSVNNLEWCSLVYNINYGTGIYRRSEKSKKKVCQYDLNGNYIQTWNSIKDAGCKLNIQHANISACCKGKLKQTGNYIWKYKE